MLSHAASAVCATLALADLFQIPLITAITLAISWGRRWRRAWVAVSAAAACWAAWVVIVGLFIPFSPSSYLLIVAGVGVDPRGTWNPASNHVRVMILGVASVLVGAWGVPTIIAWGVSRVARRPPRSPALAPRPSWRIPATLLLALITMQGLLLGIAQYVRGTVESPGGMFIGPETSYCSAALALVVPVVGAAIATAYAALRYGVGVRQAMTDAPARWRRGGVRALLIGLALGFAIRGALTYGTTCGPNPLPAVRTEINGR